MSAVAETVASVLLVMFSIHICQALFPIVHFSPAVCGGLGTFPGFGAFVARMR